MANEINSDEVLAASLAATMNGEDIQIDEDLFDGEDIDQIEEDLETLELDSDEWQLWFIECCGQVLWAKEVRKVREYKYIAAMINTFMDCRRENFIWDIHRKELFNLSANMDHDKIFYCKKYAYFVYVSYVK